jgi:hypothetical protein
MMRTFSRQELRAERIHPTVNRLIGLEQCSPLRVEQHRYAYSKKADGYLASDIGVREAIKEKRSITY